MRKWLSLSMGVALMVCATALWAADRRVESSSNRTRAVAERTRATTVAANRAALDEHKSIRLVRFQQTPEARPLLGPGPDPYPMPVTSAPPGSALPGSAPPAMVLQPVPDSEPVPYAEGACDLFPCVKYRDVRKIAPCAVPMVVSVKDPCVCLDPCTCCPVQKCVNVKICVPPCDCPCVKIVRNGNKVVYDYGKYVIEITSRNGKVIVDYDRRWLFL